jgi:hypothetical protein
MSWVESVFKPNYYQELNKMPDRQRGDGFLVMFEALENILNSRKRKVNRCHILETGCMRPGGELASDGQSTRLFYEFCKFHDGSLISIDISPSHAVHATRAVESEYALIYESDSVDFLWHKLPLIEPYYVADLIYLDSYDVDFREPWRSNLHHIKELVAAAPYVRKGTIIAVDDCLFPANDRRISPGVDPNLVGKGTFVDGFMTDIGAEKLHDGYQKVWRFR